MNQADPISRSNPPSNHPPQMLDVSKSDPYRQFAIVEATFLPARTDDLRDRCGPYVGKRMKWMAYWVSEERPYAGQMVWSEHRDDEEGLDGMMLGWVPTCDLADIVLIDRGLPMYDGEPE